MKKKKWLFLSLSLIATILITNTLLMYWSDTYSVAHVKREHFYTEPNMRVLNVAYILENKDKYDSFIFGSSRVGNINPFKIKNGSYFNMSYSEGIPKEHLLNIKLFLKEDIKIKNLLIGLDDISYQVSFLKHQTQGLTKLHPLATDTSYFHFYRDFFFRFAQGDDRSHIISKIKNPNNYITLNISQEQTIYTKMVQDRLAGDYNSTAHKEKEEFDKPAFYAGNTLKEAIDDIEQIKNICTLNDINCTFFINPIHHKSYQYLNHELLSEFKDRLAHITDFYDFTYPNPINNDNFYWYETAHFRSVVGDLMINEFEKKEKASYGIYHTKI